MAGVLLELTKCGTSQPGSIWIGADHIITMEPVKKGKTDIFLTNEVKPDQKPRSIMTNHISVTESPEEIEEQLKAKAQGRIWPPEKAFPPEGPKVYGA